MLNKVFTAARLIRQGDSKKFQEKLTDAVFQTRLWTTHGQPFIHHRLGFPFVCFPERQDSYEWYRWSQSEKYEFDILQYWIQDGDWVIDIGANVGAYTILMAHLVGKEGRIVAVEASKKLGNIIHQTSRLLNLENIIIEICCAADQDGTTGFFEAEDHSPTTWQSMQLEEQLQSGFRKVEVPTQTIDTLWSKHGNGKMPSVVKMDIEGAEVGALKGSQYILNSDNQPLWLIEINSSCLNRFGKSSEDILDFFDVHRFDRWLVLKGLENGNIVRRCLAENEKFSDAHYYNLICIPKQGNLSARAASVSKLLQEISCSN